MNAERVRELFNGHGIGNDGYERVAKESQKEIQELVEALNYTYEACLDLLVSPHLTYDARKGLQQVREKVHKLLSKHSPQGVKS